MGKNVKFYELAKEFEFSGGHIKNSIINAARLAVANNSNQVLQEHFVKAAKFVREGRNILLNFENNDKDSLVSELIARPNITTLKSELGTRPKVYYILG